MPTTTTTTTAGADLTPRQLEVYEAIYATARDQGYMPSIRTLMGRFGVTSPNGVLCHIRRLLDKGYLGKAPSAAAVSNTYRLLRRPDGRPFAGFLDKE